LIVELVEARGHPNVRAKHRTTIEVTTENYLTPRGDCIVGVNADKAAADLDRRFVEQLRNGSLTAIFVASGEAQVVRARGVPSLTSTNESKLIIRRSQYVESATVGVEADRSAGLGQEIRGAVEKGCQTLLHACGS